MSTSNVVQIEKLLTVEEVVALLGISRSKLYQLVRDGSIATVKMGRSVRFRPSRVQEFVERSETTAEAATLVRGG